jgi:hypothetical protein
VSDSATSVSEVIFQRPAIEALRSFLHVWHGIDPDDPRWLMEDDLPPGLAVLLPHERTLCREMHLMLPEPDLEQPSRSIFCVEKRGEWQWSFEGDGTDNPPIASQEGGSGWQREELRLDEFLLTLAIRESTVLGSYRFGAYTGLVATRQLTAALAILQPVEAAWRFHGIRCYTLRDAIAFTDSPNGQQLRLYLAAKSAAALRFLNELIRADPLPWEEIRVDGKEHYPIDGF